MAENGNLIHATCVAIGEQGVLIRGPSGSGKSDLALRLMHTPTSVAGGVVKLVSDDQVIVAGEHGRLIARTAPNLENRLEVRGIGIVTVETRSETTVGLVVDALPNEVVPRMPTEDERSTTILSVCVPRLALDLTEPSAVAKILIALGMSVACPTKSA